MECEKAEKIRNLLSSFIHVADQQNRGEENVEDNTDSEQEGQNVQSQAKHSRDRKAFLTRLQTFTPFKWFAKPDWLSPPMCVRYGWQNVDRDLLQCVSCKCYITGKMPSSYKPGVYDECCKKLEESLKSAHHPFCPWSNNPSPEYYLNISIPSKAQLRDQLTSLVSYGEKLPKIGDELLDKLEVKANALLKWKEKLKITENCEDSVFISACVLVICGWLAKRSSGKYLYVSCSYCSRDCGLWNYIPLSSDPDLEESDEDLDIFSPLKKPALYSNSLSKENQTGSEEKSSSAETLNDIKLCIDKTTEVKGKNISDDQSNKDKNESCSQINESENPLKDDMNGKTQDQTQLSSNQEDAEQMSSNQEKDSSKGSIKSGSQNKLSPDKTVESSHNHSKDEYKNKGECMETEEDIVNSEQTLHYQKQTGEVDKKRNKIDDIVHSLKSKMEQQPETMDKNSESDAINTPIETSGDKKCDSSSEFVDKKKKDATEILPQFDGAGDNNKNPLDGESPEKPRSDSGSDDEDSEPVVEILLTSSEEEEEDEGDMVEEEADNEGMDTDSEGIPINDLNEGVEYEIEENDDVSEMSEESGEQEYSEGSFNEENESEEQQSEEEVDEEEYENHRVPRGSDSDEVMILSSESEQGEDEEDEQTVPVDPKHIQLFQPLGSPAENSAEFDAHNNFDVVKEDDDDDDSNNSGENGFTLRFNVEEEDENTNQTDPNEPPPLEREESNCLDLVQDAKSESLESWGYPESLQDRNLYPDLSTELTEVNNAAADVAKNRPVLETANNQKKQDSLNQEIEPESPFEKPFKILTYIRDSNSLREENVSDGKVVDKLNEENPYSENIEEGPQSLKEKPFKILTYIRDSSDLSSKSSEITAEIVHNDNKVKLMTDQNGTNFNETSNKTIENNDPNLKPTDTCESSGTDKENDNAEGNVNSLENEQCNDDVNTSEITETESTMNESISSPTGVSRKRKKRSIRESFNPLTEHRAWCPWVQGNYPHVSEGTRLPGWKQMVVNIVPESTPEKEDIMKIVKTSPPYEGLRKIRKLFHGWASPHVK